MSGDPDSVQDFGEEIECPSHPGYFMDLVDDHYVCVAEGCDEEIYPYEPDTELEDGN